MHFSKLIPDPFCWFQKISLNSVKCLVLIAKDMLTIPPEVWRPEFGKDSGGWYHCATDSYNSLCCKVSTVRWHFF